jgi:hypothetical protein
VASRRRQWRAPRHRHRRATALHALLAVPYRPLPLRPPLEGDSCAGTQLRTCSGVHTDMRPTTQGARARSVRSNTHHRSDMVASAFFGREGSFGGDQVWRERKISRANILVGTTVTMPAMSCVTRCRCGGCDAAPHAAPRLVCSSENTDGGSARFRSHEPHIGRSDEHGRAALVPPADDREHIAACTASCVGAV